MVKNNGIHWTSETEWVDIETGEVYKKRPETHIKLHTLKATKINANETKGHIKYTIECRRNPQQQLAFNNT